MEWEKYEIKVKRNFCGVEIQLRISIWAYTLKNTVCVQRHTFTKYDTRYKSFILGMCL